MIPHMETAHAAGILIQAVMVASVITLQALRVLGADVAIQLSARHRKDWRGHVAEHLIVGDY